MEASCASNHVAIEEGVLQGLGLLHGGRIKDKKDDAVECYSKQVEARYKKVKCVKKGGGDPAPTGLEPSKKRRSRRTN